ncbi:hypothetical protein Q0M94_02280 [Deinococcus radiomollis]|uniref:hypothetical protein n=1 Tax=Deinococcus radiomollis TaxID=468916 RepID=UPI0038917DE2
MTQTTLLSAKIAALEATAAPLSELESALEVLTLQRDQLLEGIAAARNATAQLDLIGLHVGAVLDGHPVTIEITGGAELPDTHEIPEPEEAETEASPEPVQEDEPSPATAPETVDQLTDAPTPEPQVPAETPEEAGPVMTNAARILAYLAEHPGSGAATIGEAIGLTAKRAGSVLSGLRLSGQIEHDDSWPYLWSLPAPAQAKTDPVAEARLSKKIYDKVRPPTQVFESMPPIPEALGFDERTLFDALRRELDGLSRGLLVSRLNWAGARVDRSVSCLLDAGHVGRRGDRFMVVPHELVGEAAS